MFQLKSESSLQAQFPLPRGISVIIFLRSSTDWMRPTPTMEVNLLYLESTDLNVNVMAFMTTFMATSKLVSGQISGYCGPAKLTDKVNHHRQYIAAIFRKAARRPGLLEWE